MLSSLPFSLCLCLCFTASRKSICRLIVPTIFISVVQTEIELISKYCYLFSSLFSFLACRTSLDLDCHYAGINYCTTSACVVFEHRTLVTRVIKCFSIINSNVCKNKEIYCRIKCSQGDLEEGVRLSPARLQKRETLAAA